MKYKDLSSEVLTLGFETEWEEEAVLLSAVRRAITTIYTELPRSKTKELYKQALERTEHSDIVHGSDENVTVKYDAKAYSFRTVGAGTYTLSDGRGSNSVSFTSEQNVHRGFLYGNGEINFSGSYAYTVYDIVFYKDILSANEADIPIKNSCSQYLLSELIPDGVSPLGIPSDGNGEPIEGSEISGGVMFIPENYFGKIILRYKKAPMLPTGDGEEEIDVPQGCEHLLPLLCAAYAWLDDDPEKAQYYMSLYRSGMDSLRYFTKNVSSIKPKDTNGWA